MSGGGGGFFDRFFCRQRARGTQGANIEVELTVPLERVLNGGEETTRISRPDSCPACHGSRAEPGTASRSCKGCNGTGKHVTSSRKGVMSFQQITTCAACEGLGTIIDNPCSNCHGRGEVTREETLAVKIPPGVERAWHCEFPAAVNRAANLAARPGTCTS